MTIDNLHILQSVLDNPDDKQFFLIQIIHRKKDGDSIHFSSNNTMISHIIKSYFIKSFDELSPLMPEIKALCNLFNARAYFYPNPKSFKKFYLNSVHTLIDYIDADIVKNPFSILNSEANLTPIANKNKLWILDVDTHDVSQINHVISVANSNFNPNVIASIPTPNGVHLLSRPFDINYFNHNLNFDVVIQKNNPTILFANLID